MYMTDKECDPLHDRHPVTYKTATAPTRAKSSHESPKGLEARTDCQLQCN